MRENLKEMTLVYAEDEPSVQKNMQEYLESYFKKVYVASDGREALSLYHCYKPDVLILDIYMPIQDGLEVAREVRKKDSYTRILMLSAYSDTKLLLQATEIDMSRYLIKPVSPHDFKEALTKVAQELRVFASDVYKLDSSTYFDTKIKSLVVDSQEVVLSSKEKKLLHLLIKNKNRCVSYDEIVVHVWEGIDEEVSRDSIKSQVNNLRKKLPKKSIENVYAQGYCLRV